MGERLRRAEGMTSEARAAQAAENCQVIHSLVAKHKVLPEIKQRLIERLNLESDGA